MKEIDNIIDKVLFIGGFKTKKNLAKWLKIDASAISQWKRTGNIPKNHLNKIENIIFSEEKSQVVNENQSQNVTGNNIVSVHGTNNSVSHSNNAVNGEYSNDIQEICSLLQEYGSPKMMKDLKSKLLKIKKLHE